MHRRWATADDLVSLLQAEEAAIRAEQKALDAAWELDQRRQASKGPVAPEMLALRLKWATGKPLTETERWLIEQEIFNEFGEMAQWPAEEREIENRAAAAEAAMRRRQRYRRN